MAGAEEDKLLHEQALLASADLSEDDRRRIKRRASNRESARRTRQKRTVKLKDYEERCDKLRVEISTIYSQLHETHRHYGDAAATNQALRAEVQAFRDTHPETSAQVPATALSDPPPHASLPSVDAPNAATALQFAQLPDAPTSASQDGAAQQAPTADVGGAYAGMQYAELGTPGGANAGDMIPTGFGLDQGGGADTAGTSLQPRVPQAPGELYLPPSLFQREAQEQPAQAVPATLPHPDGAGPSHEPSQAGEASAGHMAAPSPLDIHSLIAARFKTDNAGGEKPATDLTSMLLGASGPNSAAELVTAAMHSPGALAGLAPAPGAIAQRPAHNGEIAAHSIPLKHELAHGDPAAAQPVAAAAVPQPVMDHAPSPPQPRGHTGLDPAFEGAHAHGSRGAAPHGSPAGIGGRAEGVGMPAPEGDITHEPPPVAAIPLPDGATV